MPPLHERKAINRARRRGIEPGAIVRSTFRAPWFGVVLEVDGSLCRVRLICDRTGRPYRKGIIKTLGGTGMAVGAFCALVLDNVIPGTDEERGLTAFAQNARPSAPDEPDA